MKVSCECHYDSAHYLPNLPDGHKCKRLHGHTYRLIVTLAGPINVNGWVMDFADVKTVVEPVIAQLDHRLLNDVIPNPTVENQLLWLWQHIDLPNLHELTLFEGLTNSATYDGRDSQKELA